MTEEEKKNIYKVGFAGFFCPGLGHLLNGNLSKGILTALACFVSIFCLYFLGRFGFVFYVTGFIFVFLIYFGSIFLSIRDSKRKPSPVNKSLGFWIKFIFVLVTWIGLLIFKGSKTMLPGEIYTQNSAGAFPSIRNGETIFFDQLSYSHEEPKRGDIVVFTTPKDKKIFFLKRIIGLPGDQISWLSGELLINGVKVDRTLESTVSDDDEKAIFPDSKDGKHTIFKETLSDSEYKIVLGERTQSADPPAVTVPPESYYVLGDHRTASYDSRFFGFVPKRAIAGKALYIAWPRDSSQDFNWKRLGKSL